SEKPNYYEDLWFHGLRSLGCRRHGPLNLGHNKQVVICISGKGTDVDIEQNHAAGNAILRLIMDTYLQGNMVTAVIVPDASINDVADALQQRGFYIRPEPRPDEAVSGSLIIRLRGERSGVTRTLVFT